jgi:hypothetical protein
MWEPKSHEDEQCLQAQEVRMKQVRKILILLAACATVMGGCALLDDPLFVLATVSGYVRSSLTKEVYPTITVSGADGAGWVDVHGTCRQKGSYEVKWVEPGTHTITLTYGGPQARSATYSIRSLDEYDVPVTATPGNKYFDPMDDAYYYEWTITIDGVSVKNNMEVDFYLGNDG